MLHDVLGGGGTTSLRNDPQGKGYAQILLSCKISVPKNFSIEVEINGFKQEVKRVSS